MATFSLLVTLDVPEADLHREVAHTIEVPPDYQPADKIQLYAVSLENAVIELVESETWRAPLRHALLANDARAREIERRANSGQVVTSAKLLEILNTPSQDAIALWGDEPTD